MAKNINIDISFLHLDIILPIGISFYTFQTLSYVCDVYWRRMKPVQHLQDFALFVCYFPPLVAGPIERASHLVPKILAKRTVNFDQIAHGGYLILFLLGLVKKITIADGLAGTVASIYNSTGSVGWLDIVVSTIAFTLQIYGDFSGYSDIASGVSLWFGIELLRNFNQPYFSVNPSEFWRRWHISLSSWLRDYLYIPLGGNRGTEISTLRNLMLTMVLGGLWHGAAWNFILWGGYQGSLLVIHRLFTGGKTKEFAGKLWARLPRMLFFLIFVCYGCYYSAPTH
ncbi:MBOAT family O-acyltransferase [Methylocucumis oryzae]|uniref:MBOAT family O-acyltransferase n=1 Tax=Methylocucumis oryzae TaxID=1632867 RepID=UPI0012FECFD3|nr:MBOAT family O-acyltransferase [Methylocucumis oryzae]